MLKAEAILTLRCPLGHVFQVRWPLVEHGVKVPANEHCSECGLPGRLVRGERVDR